MVQSASSFLPVIALAPLPGNLDDLETIPTLALALTLTLTLAPALALTLALPLTLPLT